MKLARLEKAAEGPSQTKPGVFARCLNVSTGYLSQLERGVKEPTGAAPALLNVIKRKGIEVIL